MIIHTLKFRTINDLPPFKEYPEIIHTNSSALEYLRSPTIMINSAQVSSGQQVDRDGKFGSAEF